MDTPIVVFEHPDGTFEWRALKEGEHWAIGGPAVIRSYAGEKVHGVSDDGDADDLEAENVKEDRTVVVLEEDGEHDDVEPHLFNVSTPVTPWTGTDFFEIDGKMYSARSPFSSASRR